MRNLTPTELKIVGLLVNGIRPKRYCAHSIYFIWNCALASC